MRSRDRQRAWGAGRPRHCGESGAKGDEGRCRPWFSSRCCLTPASRGSQANTDQSRQLNGRRWLCLATTAQTGESHMAHRLRPRRRGIVLRVVRSVIGTVPLTALHETAHGRSPRISARPQQPRIAEPVPTRRPLTADHGWPRLSTAAIKKPRRCSTLASGLLPQGTANSRLQSLDHRFDSGGRLRSAIDSSRRRSRVVCRGFARSLFDAAASRVEVPGQA